MFFENAQLKEAVVEIRWTPVDANGELQPLNQPFVLASGEAEAFLERFRVIVAAHGYSTSERLIAQNSIHPAYAAILRFKADAGFPPIVIQIGAGVLSVHALPPYRSWNDFKPKLVEAMEWLKEARSPLRSDVPANASLRYINGFDAEFREGITERTFLEEMLQIKIGIPDVIGRRLSDPVQVDASVQFNARLANGMHLSLNAGTLTLPPADFVLDTTIALQRFVLLNGEELEGLLDEAHGMLSEMFFEMTAKMHGKLGLVEDAEAGK